MTEKTNHKEEAKRYVDNFVDQSKLYLLRCDDREFRELFKEMRRYWTWVNDEVCPFHLLEKVKKKGG